MSYDTVDFREVSDKEKLANIRTVTMERNSYRAVTSMCGNY